MLGTCALAGNNNATWEVSYSDGATGFLHMLAAGPAGAECLYLDIVRFDINFYIAFSFRHHFYKGKRGMPGMVCVKGGKTNQAVHAVLGFQISSRVFSIKSNNHSFNTCFITRRGIQYFSLETTFLRPAQVHPH